MQFDLDQPPGQQVGGRKRPEVQHPYREPPCLIGQLRGDGAKRHRRDGQVLREVLGVHPRAGLNVGLACLGAGVRGAVLSRPGPGQQVTHRVGVPGDVGENVRPRPPRQQGRRAEVRLGDDAGDVEQALGGLIDLVKQLAVYGVHQLTLKKPRPLCHSGHDPGDSVSPPGHWPNCPGRSARSAVPAGAGEFARRGAVRTAAALPRCRSGRAAAGWC
jgi:hypothetical protein